MERVKFKGYEGLCFVLATSKDHCATETEWLRSYGYEPTDTHYRRFCTQRTAFTHPTVNDHYCGYHGDSRSYYPDYDACTAYVLIEYRNVWIENEVLQQPPYTFEFTNSSNNEYVDKELSDKMDALYREYEKIQEYKDGTLPAAINRLANALTEGGREIARVNIEGDLLDLAYQADKERMLSIQENISLITEEIFMHTLTDKDLKEIIEFSDKDRCCIIDVNKNVTVKYYPLDQYICGVIADYVYIGPLGNKYLMINNSFISYDYLNHSKLVVKTCYNVTLIPLDTDEAKRQAEDAIISAAIEDALEELFNEIDTNISMAITSEVFYTANAEYTLGITINVVSSFVVLIALMIICFAIRIYWFSRKNTYNILKNVESTDGIEMDVAECTSMKQVS